MDFTSFKTYLKTEKPKPADYIRFLKLLFQGIALHAVESDRDELSAFRRELDRISTSLSDVSSADNIVLAVGMAIHAMEEYNRRASLGLKAYSQELKGLLAMTTETIAFLSASSQTGIEKLTSIEKGLSQASGATDLRVLKDKLGDCLELVRHESVRLRSETQVQINTLNSSVKQVSTAIHSIAMPSGTTDTTTGLPGRKAAEQVIANRITSGPAFAVALFMIDRLPSINGRFGRIAGDTALMMIAQHLAHKSEDVGVLMRWSGPGFISVLETPDGFQDAERKVKEVAGVRLDMEVSTAERKTMVPLTCSWLLNRISAGESAEAVFQKLDNCLALHS